MRLLRRRSSLLVLTLCALSAAALAGTAESQTTPNVRLEARAVLPALTFAPGPSSGRQLGTAPINGVTPPFEDEQPVQGFSAVLDNGDGTFLAMADNGYGAIENSADFNLRIYTIRPSFKRAFRGSGRIDILGFFQLHDPDRRIPFAITNHFTSRRVLTGADFDIESIQRGPDGTLWIGDEFGPFVVHTDARGRVLEAPIALPDFDNPGREIRSPQNPYNEEATAIRIMNAVREHARRFGNERAAPVFSPFYVMLADADPTTFVDSREAPPTGSGVARASSDVYNVASLKAAGYPIVPYTINDKPRMLQLLRLGVDGIISDRPDLLREVAQEFDANGDGRPGDLLLPDGRIDITKLDAQGHRGGRNLRPENTLPAAEVALANLMTTIEGDVGVSRDGVPIMSHDPYVESQKCRRADGRPYGPADEVLIRNLTADELQSQFICDKLFRGPTQVNDLAASPVTVAYRAASGLWHEYTLPTVQQLFDFVDFYVNYYRTGAGRTAPDADRLARNAEAVRFNLETKLNPRTDADENGNVYASRTVSPQDFASKLAGTIALSNMQRRADIQSFDFRTLLLVQEQFPAIRTVYLFGDFPRFTDTSVAGTDDGTNLQPQPGGTTSPWLAGLYYPYRTTVLTHPFRAQRSGGFEGMAVTTDGRQLLPLLELPLVGGEAGTLLIHELDIASRSYTGVRYRYRIDARGTAIGDFTMFSPTRGLIIERDGSQDNLNGFKAIYEVELGSPGSVVQKTLLVDPLRIQDPRRISEPGLPGDVGLGRLFAFPFTTIESVVIFDRRRIGVLNDNNFPFSVGRHVGSGRPDDNEFIILRLDKPLALARSGR